MKLSVLSVVLGLGISLPSAYGLMKPAALVDAARKFPRSQLWGWTLVAVATLWFLYYLSLESVADFAAYKPMMYVGFAALGLLTCIFLNDFLAVRGLALVLMLLAKLMLDTARWSESPWRLVIVVLAYLMILEGMWFTVSPWRCRDLLQWGTATEQRLRLGSAMKLVFGCVIIGLGLFAF